MTKRYRYNKSPIIEAAIDLRLGLTPNRTPDSLLPIGQQIAPDYLNSKEIVRIQGKFTPEQSVTQERSLIGFRYDSRDGKYLLQTRIDGFTLSRFQPYEHWEPFRDEARRLWTIFRRCADPLTCIRAAVRYVNRIDLPSAPSEMKDYFRTYPEVSPDMPQTMTGYLMQVLMPQKNDVMLSLIQASVSAPTPNTVSVNLDLDLYKESTSAFTSEERIWNFLESLREMRDHIFESCITDKARTLFEPIE